MSLGVHEAGEFQAIVPGLTSKYTDTDTGLWDPPLEAFRVKYSFCLVEKGHDLNCGDADDDDDERACVPFNLSSVMQPPYEPAIMRTARICVSGCARRYPETSPCGQNWKFGECVAIPNEARGRCVCVEGYSGTACANPRVNPYPNATDCTGSTPWDPKKPDRFVTIVNKLDNSLRINGVAGTGKPIPCSSFTRPRAEQVLRLPLGSDKIIDVHVCSDAVGVNCSNTSVPLILHYRGDQLRYEDVTLPSIGAPLCSWGRDADLACADSRMTCVAGGSLSGMSIFAVAHLDGICVNCTFDGALCNNTGTCKLREGSIKPMCSCKSQWNHSPGGETYCNVNTMEYRALWNLLKAGAAGFGAMAVAATIDRCLNSRRDPRRDVKQSWVTLPIVCAALLSTGTDVVYAHSLFAHKGSLDLHLYGIAYVSVSGLALVCNVWITHRFFCHALRDESGRKGVFEFKEWAEWHTPMVKAAYVLGGIRPVLLSIMYSRIGNGCIGSFCAPVYRQRRLWLSSKAIWTSLLEDIPQICIVVAVTMQLPPVDGLSWWSNNATLFTLLASVVNVLFTGIGRFGVCMLYQSVKQPAGFESVAEFGPDGRPTMPGGRSSALNLFRDDTFKSTAAYASLKRESDDQFDSPDDSVGRRPPRSRPPRFGARAFLSDNTF